MTTDVIHNTTSVDAKALRFQRLAQKVQDCRLCPRMEGRRRVLGPLNGSLSASVVFVAEAPGRLGADRDGIPLWGDQSGRNFNALIKGIGWDRSSLFITNAVLCNPRDGKDRNLSPASQEVRNCSQHLRELLDVIQPEYVVTLGKKTLNALSYIEPHNIELRRDVANPSPWRDIQVVPLYHPAPRALIHRSMEGQRADYRKLDHLLHGDGAGEARDKAVQEMSLRR